MPFHANCMTETEPQFHGYQIKIDGQEVQTDTARVSAVPFNRRWPGHQRSLDQTELVNFLNVETDGPVEFAIKPAKPFDHVKIRPLSLGITPTIENGTICFTLPHPAYFTVEPYGRHNALHIFADKMKDYGVTEREENVLYFGAGIHDAGMIHLQSNQTLFLDEGAVVYACVRAFEADHIRILGKGILDNSRNKEQILFEANEENNAAAVNNAVREHTVQLEYCNHVLIDGITIRDSLVYNIRPIGCTGLTIQNVKIIGCWRYNSDGIDMHNCKDVLIDSCFVRTYDDSICVKGFDCYYEGEDVEAEVQKMMHYGGKDYDVFRNVLVKNCVIWTDWGHSLEIGAETRVEDISNIVFEDCDVIHVCDGVLDCFNVDYAPVHDVHYRRIRVEADEELIRPQIQNTDRDTPDVSQTDFIPTICRCCVTYHPEYSAGGERRGQNYDISFEDISYIGSHKPIFSFTGFSPVAGNKDITVKDFYWNGKKSSSASDYQLEQDDFSTNCRILFTED